MNIKVVSNGDFMVPICHALITGKENVSKASAKAFSAKLEYNVTKKPNGECRQEYESFIKNCHVNSPIIGVEMVPQSTFVNSDLGYVYLVESINNMRSKVNKDRLIYIRFDIKPGISEFYTDMFIDIHNLGYALDNVIDDVVAWLIAFPSTEEGGFDIPLEYIDSRRLPDAIRYVILPKGGNA